MIIKMLYICAEVDSKWKKSINKGYQTDEVNHESLS